jgi:hypothetical protein
MRLALQQSATTSSCGIDKRTIDGGAVVLEETFKGFKKLLTLMVDRAFASEFAGNMRWQKPTTSILLNI